MNTAELLSLYSLYLEGAETKQYNVCQSTGEHYNYRAGGLFGDDHLRSMVERSFAPPAVQSKLKIPRLGELEHLLMMEHDLTLREFLLEVYKVKFVDQWASF